ncbi:MAG TPA: family 2 encapsulin nanocompartment cargo protein polyprenyl transferase [Pseudonocardiaceae bacterium]|jgi:geranylgeranyl diphosphate synthase type I|nr:family 2 encapsulin nanocompartment cargo protein polyprenyl transferase [Pseudonocardiaceae bacterium]
MTTIDVTTVGRSVGEVLAWSRSVVEPALRAAVGTLPCSMSRIAGYHFGWWNEHGQSYRAPEKADNAHGGKAIRPTLVLLSAQAVGGVPAAAVPAAVAVELVHNFSLLHDDVMDADLTRRHRPTAWSVFGRNAAILAGDALLTLALDVLAASGHPAATRGTRMLSAAVQDLLDGQCADLAFEQRAEIKLAECLRMAERKTAALMGCACAVGAAFGAASPERVQYLRGFGDHLGLAFQHVDDLLGIWGDPSVTGKPVYSDLHSRKKSLPVVATLTSDTPAGHELAALYHHQEPLSDTDLVHAAELIDLAGGRAWSQTQIENLLTQAMRDLHSAHPTRQAAAELGALARLATHRDH